MHVLPAAETEQAYIKFIQVCYIRALFDIYANYESILEAIGAPS